MFFAELPFLGLTYPLLGISEGTYETFKLKIKIDPRYFLNFRCPLGFDGLISTTMNDEGVPNPLSMVVLLRALHLVSVLSVTSKPHSSYPATTKILFRVREYSDTAMNWGCASPFHVGAASLPNATCLFVP